MTDFRNNVHDSDESLQKAYAGENIIPSRSDHQISDGQKRYGTLLGDTSSNYPKPKTMFYVSFNYADGYSSIDKGEIASKTLSKYVVDVTKPNVRFTTKKMNQYNRIKYIYENVEYGDLKITFMDTKNSNLEQILFKFLKNVDKDFKHHHDVYKEYAQNSVASYGYQWGLHARSNERLFKSITIAEMYFDRLMIYTVENPLISDINFGDNKIGDYSPNKITVTFKVEGITNDITIDKNSQEYKNVIGKYFTSVGGADMAHFLEKRWNDNSSTTIIKEDFYETPKNASNAQIQNYREMQIDRSNSKIKESKDKLLLQQWVEDNRDLENQNEAQNNYFWVIDPYTGRKTLVRSTNRYKFQNHSQWLSLFKF